MANPAELLHQQLSAWRKRGDLKDVRKVPADEGWEAMRFAVINLDNCMTLLERMKADKIDTRPWAAYTNAWSRAVFGYEVQWNSATTKSTNGGVDEHALNALLSLSAMLDSYVPRLEAEGLGSLREMLESDVLENPAAEYPVELLAYFKRVKNHLEWCVDHFDQVGEFGLHEAAMQFRMTVLFMTQSASSEDERSRWRTFWKERFVWPFVTTTVTTGPAEIAYSKMGELGKTVLELIAGG